MEHRRVRGIRIDAIDAARRDDANLGHRFEVLVLLHMLLHVAHLDRAGMRAQQDAFGRLAVVTLQIKSVVHGTRGMVVRRVQCGEIVEIGFDLGAIGHFKTDRTEQAFDALQRACHRMDSTAHLAATRQGDVQRFFSQTRFKRR